MGYIYMVTNTVNGKRYIGQSTCDDIHKRWNTHKRVRKACLGTALYNAYRKYGVNNFTYKIICICFDEDCNRFEEEYIRKYNTITPNGYNMKLLGGSYKVSDETRALLSERAKAWWNTEGRREAFISPVKGSHLTSEHKEKLRNAQKARWNGMTESEKADSLHKMGIGNGLPSRYKSEETKQRALDALKEYRCTHKRRVAQYSLENTFIKEYGSVMEAAITSGICRTTISKVCLNNSKYKTAGGYIWKYVV